MSYIKTNTVLTYAILYINTFECVKFYIFKDFKIWHDKYNGPEIFF